MEVYIPEERKFYKYETWVVVQRNRRFFERMRVGFKNSSIRVGFKNSSILDNIHKNVMYEMETLHNKVKADPVKHPNHYTWIEGIECKDVVKHFDFFKGSAIKYIWRSGKKGDHDKHIQDIEKAIEALNIVLEDLKDD